MVLISPSKSSGLELSTLSGSGLLADLVDAAAEDVVVSGASSGDVLASLSVVVVAVVAVSVVVVVVVVSIAAVGAACSGSAVTSLIFSSAMSGACASLRLGGY